MGRISGDWFQAQVFKVQLTNTKYWRFVQGIGFPWTKQKEVTVRRANRLRRLGISGVLVLVFSLSLFVGTVWAADYMGTGQFPVRQLRWTYTGVVAGYETRADVSMGSWHSGTDLSLIKVTSSWDIMYSTWDYGDSGWVGWAYICDGQGNCANQTAWNNQYASCDARVNRHFTDSYNNTKKENVFMHEAGHCFSLGHRWWNPGIMYPYVREYNTLNDKDKQLINSRY